jgi:F-type H+-transporting ATPase subunit delta
VADSTGRYEGVVEGDIEEEVIPQLEEMLGKKFNSTVKLQLKRRKVGGIKLFIDVLNVEVELVEKRLKENLIQLILKAI